MVFPILRMIREDSSVDAPHSFEVSLSCALARHHASHVLPRRLVPALFPAAAAGCAILGYSCRREICCFSTSVSTRQLSATSCCLLRFCAFLGFLLLRHYVRMSTFFPSVVFLTRASKLRGSSCNDAALASVPSCRSTHLPTVPFDVLPRRSGTLFAVSRLHVFLRSGSSVFAFVKSMTYLRGVTSHRLSRL